MNYIDDKTIYEICDKENVNANINDIFRSNESDNIFILIDNIQQKFIRIISYDDNKYEVKFIQLNAKPADIVKLTHNHNLPNNYIIDDKTISNLLYLSRLNYIIDMDNAAIFRSDEHTDFVLSVYLDNMTIFHLVVNNTMCNISSYNLNLYYKQSKYQVENDILEKIY